MLISVLTGPINDLEASKFQFSQMDCYVILNNDASKAHVILRFSVEIENLLQRNRELILNMILPPTVRNVTTIGSKSQKTNSIWLDPDIDIVKGETYVALIKLDLSQGAKHKNLALGLQYEVPLSSPSLDLSLHASTTIGNILYKSDPQQQPITIGHAYIWLTYNTKNLQVLSTQNASEEILMGADILNSNSMLTAQSINPRTQYSQLMWRTTRPSSVSPFYLNAILRSGGEDTSRISEFKDIIFNIEQRVKIIENSLEVLDSKIQRLEDNFDRL